MDFTAPWLIATYVLFVAAMVTGTRHLGPVGGTPARRPPVLLPAVCPISGRADVALAPVFVIWLGFGIESKVLIAVTTAFFVVLVNTMAGLQAPRRNSILLMQSLVASRRQMFTMLTLPAALPYIFAGLKTGATLALIGALVGEFMTAQAGLGRLLTQFNFSIRRSSLCHCDRGRGTRPRNVRGGKPASSLHRVVARVGSR